MDKNNIAKKLTEIETLCKEIYSEITEDDHRSGTIKQEENTVTTEKEKAIEQTNTLKTNDNIYKM